MDKRLVIKAIEDAQTTLKELKKQHSSLNQIDMLSSEGNKLWSRINLIVGKINALEWVLSEIIESENDITEDVLLSLDFEKVEVSAEESGDEEYIYFRYPANDGKCLLITSDYVGGLENDKYVVEFFDDFDITITKAKKLKKLIKALK